MIESLNDPKGNEATWKLREGVGCLEDEWLDEMCVSTSSG